MNTDDFRNQKLKTILIDADVNSLREISRVIINNTNLNLVTTCKTGRAAINALKETPVDLIILNPALPDANGFDLISALPPNPPVVVIVSDRIDYAYFAYRIDAVDYRLKPVTPDLLEGALDRVYRRLMLNHALAEQGLKFDFR
jgi:two-component system LytT family response regulator